MEIFIPNHLRRIVVVEQLYEMIQEYSENYYEDVTSSFDDYQYYQKLDAVKRFIGMVYEKPDDISDEEYESIVNYLSRLFYSVKGTLKVFDFIEEYLDLEIEDLSYTIRELSITIKNLDTTDVTKFYENLEEFCAALLYFEEFNATIETINLVVDSEIITKVSADVIPYNTEEFTYVGGSNKHE